MVTANVIHRVFRLKVGENIGTAFAIAEGGKEYLITARHIASPLVGLCEIELFQKGAWSQFQVTTVGHATGDRDISVLAPLKRLTPVNPLPLPVGSDGLVYGQDAYFLGFPYNILTKFILGGHGFPLPLVKRVTVSAFDQGAFLLDGHNNPGFSGGPLVFRPSNHREFQVAAVVSGYQAIEEPILLRGQPTPLSYMYNTGIVVAYDVGEAISLIKANPVGLDLGAT